MHFETKVTKFENGTNDNKDQESSPSWAKLWYDVTQETTFHGVRFITQKQTYMIRRMMWALVVLTCVIVFLNNFSLLLQHLNRLPKAIDVEIVHEAELTFPSVTICNQNFFRGSETFKMGVYDQVNDRFRPVEDSGGGGCKEREFSLVEGRYASLMPHSVSWGDVTKAGYYASYHQVTLQVCRHLCMTYHDPECNAFVYLLANKTCHMTSLTPFIQPQAWDRSSSLNVYIHDNLNLNTYVRKRCSGHPVSCDFETTTCPFYQDTEALQLWGRKKSGGSGTGSTGPTHDHTLLHGHYLLAKSAYYTQGTKPTLTSHFLHAEHPLCVRFAYNLRGSDIEPGALKVHVKTALGGQKTMWESRGVSLTEWDLAIVHLGTGLFQMLFEAETGSGELGYVSLDDIIILPCSDIVEDCHRTVSGTDYFGNQSVTVNGSLCEPWSLSSYSGQDFPDGHTNHSSCRNPSRDPRGPWCYVQGLLQYCDTPMCACQGDEFRCGEGVCLHPLKVCDGTPDCENQEDELTQCEISVNCDFESVNSCGYEITSPWLLYGGNIYDRKTVDNQTLPTDEGHYLLFDSSQILLKHGERAAVTSPVVTNETQRGQCLSFYLYYRIMGTSPESMGTLTVYQTFGRYQRKPLAVFHGSTEDHWYMRRVTLPLEQRKFSIMFEVTQGYTFYSDMVIDDIQIEATSACSEVFPCEGVFVPADSLCDGTVSCPDLFDERNCSYKDSLFCEFQDGYKCGYRDESNPDKGGWASYNESVQFVALKDEPMSADSVKRLVSPIVTLETDVCLTVIYRINPTELYYCLISLYQEVADKRTELKIVGGSDIGAPYTWREVHITIPADELFQLSFEARCNKDDDRITADILSISYNKVSCEDRVSTGQFECFFNNTSCDYLDLSEGAASWVTTSQGLKVGLPSVTDVKNVTSRLLSPILNIEEPRCIMVKAKCKGSIGSVGSPRLTIVDYYNESNVYYYSYLHLRDEMNIQLLLSVGSHQLLFVGEIGEPSDLYLTSITDVGCVGSASQLIAVHTELTRDGSKPEDYVLPTQPASVAPSSDTPSYGGGGGGNSNQGSSLPVQVSGFDRLPPEDPEPELPAYYRQAGHQVGDMVYKCTWAGQPCSLANFSSSITDSGFCHTFNPGVEGHQLLKSSSSGSSLGLSLLLNIEQYDYMRGPQNNAGVKIYLHSPKDVPLVRDLGFAAGPGQSAFVAVKMSNYRRLAAPEGNCGDDPLKYYDNYTYSACLRQLETDHMTEVCGCRDAFMPGHDTNNPAFCNISTYLDCLVQGSAWPVDLSQCKEECEEDVYEAQISYSELSSFSVDQILSSNTSQLEESYSTVLEINQRADPDAIREDFKLLSNIMNLYNELLEWLSVRAWGTETSIFKKIDSALHLLLSDIIKKDYSLFLERTLDHYKPSFEQEHGPMLNTVSRYSVKIVQDLDVFLLMYETVISTGALDDRTSFLDMLETLKSSLKILSKTADVYGQALTNRAAVGQNLQPMKVLVPVKYLPTKTNLEICHPGLISSQAEVASDLYQKLGNIKTMLSPSSMSHSFNASGSNMDSYAMTDSYSWSNSGPEESSHINDHTHIESSLQDGLANQFNSTSADSQTLQALLPKLVHCLEEYYTFLRTMSESKDGTLASITSSIDSLPLAHGRSDLADILDYEVEGRKFIGHVSQMKTLLSDYIKGVRSKQEVFGIFTGSFISDSTKALTLFKGLITRIPIDPVRQRITNINSQGVQIYTQALKQQLNFSLYLTHSPIHAKDFLLWRRPQADIKYDVLVRYATDRFQLGNDLQQFIEGPMDKVLKVLLDRFTEPLTAKLNEFEENLLMYEALIRTALDDLLDAAKIYKGQTVLGPDFIRKNFLGLDIFYSQLKYEKTTQILTYTLQDVFSDIGGLMGLLLGGSVISLVEFLDLVLFNCLHKLFRFKQHSLQDKGP